MATTQTDRQAALQALASHREQLHSNRSPIAQLPDEVQALPFWREVMAGKLGSRLAPSFWELYKPQKNERCLFIGPGPSFLLDPWVQWEALFWGLELDGTLVQAVKTRAPRLNSKLFKDMREGAPHQLDPYPDAGFDLVIATGFSPYLEVSYSEQVLIDIRRVLRPGGRLLWEVVDPTSPWFEDWSIGQLYLGIEPLATLDTAQWKKLLETLGPVKTERSGELFKFLLAVRA